MKYLRFINFPYRYLEFGCPTFLSINDKPRQLLDITSVIGQNDVIIIRIPVFVIDLADKSNVFLLNLRIGLFKRCYMILKATFLSSTLLSHSHPTFRMKSKNTLLGIFYS